MTFELHKTLEILERTPAVLESLLADLSDEWIMPNEGESTFSPFDVVGHLLHGEKTDWMARLQIILRDSGDKNFTPYDRFVQFEESKGKSMNQLLGEFKTLRMQNLGILTALNIQESDLFKEGIHPKFGKVTLRHLLSTWTVHDLSHIAQITRVMCKQYKEEVGPWIEFLPILTRY